MFSGIVEEMGAVSILNKGRRRRQRERQWDLPDGGRQNRP